MLLKMMTRPDITDTAELNKMINTADTPDAEDVAYLADAADMKCLI